MHSTRFEVGKTLPVADGNAGCFPTAEQCCMQYHELMRTLFPAQNPAQLVCQTSVLPHVVLR